MTDTSTKDTIVEIVSEVLVEPVQALWDEPVLAVHAWDSVASLEALVHIEKRLGVTLDLRPYHAARDIDALVELVEATRGSQSAENRP